MFAGLIFASCQKEEVTTAPAEMQVPVWDSGADNQRGSNTDGSQNKEGDDDGSGTLSNPGTPSGSSTDVEITDPNSDPDAG